MVKQVLLKGGTVVTGEGRFSADVLVEGGKISAVGIGLSGGPGAQVFDVSGALVFPGGIDIHTHLDAPLAGTVTADNFETGSIAAAFGGTTTLVDFALHTRGKSLKSTVEVWKEKAAGKSIVDYGFHVSVVELTEKIMKEIPGLITEGITSFKCFTAYRGALMIDDGSLFKLLRLAKSANGLVMVHAESGDVIDALVEDALKSGHKEPRYHALTRPVETEEDAIGHCINLARMAESPLYIVHVSTEGGLKRIQEAQLAGLPVFGETCPHYLYLDSSVYELTDFEGAKYVCSPPIRERRHGQRLWGGLKNGSLQVLASDHCPFTFEQKKLGQEEFTKIPNGVPSLEARFLLGYQGVCDGKLSLSRFVDVVATAPAKLAGLFPRKGTIMPGADADLVFLDAGSESHLGVNTLHERSAYSPFEGIVVKGSIQHVMVRGEFIIKDKKQVVEKGYGQFLARQPFSI